MQVTRRLVVALALILLSACAARPEHIVIRPSPEAPGSVAGEGAVVQVGVRDQRSHATIIGYRAEGDAGLDQAVLASNDVTEAIRSALIDSLRELGFAPQAAHASAGSGAAVLTVTVDTLAYHQRGTGMNRVGEADVVLIGSARHGGRSFKATYKVHNENRLGVLPTSTEKTQELVNRALGKTLGNLLRDERLVSVLRD